MIDRAAFLNGVLGKPWAANARGPHAFDCFHFMAFVEERLAGRSFGDVEVPANPSWAWMIEAVERHPDRRAWRLVPFDLMGGVRAGDLAVVLMARREHAAHVGVWLEAEQCVAHCDQAFGVVFDTLSDLRMKGWTRLRFYEPIQ